MAIQDITELLLQYKYILMFALMVLEGPTVGFISAFLAAKGYFDFGIVYILSVMGDTVGDIMRYWVGRFGRRFDIAQMRDFQQHRNRISKYLFSWSIGISNRIHRKTKNLKEKSFFKYLERKAQKHFFLSLLIVKITPPISVPGQISFGFLKVHFWKFLIQTAFVCFLFESVFLNLGYFSSISANTFKDKFDTVTTVISTIAIAIIALLIGFFIIRKFRHISKRLK